MEQLFNEMLQRVGDFFFHTTGLNIPPLAILLVLIFALIKGVKILWKIAAVTFAVYVIWWCMKQGYLPDITNMLQLVKQ